MPVVGPVLVADTTNTSGTGSLTLNNASENGRRGLADAVTNGDASNGDTVHYVILSTSASGGSLVFEQGVGTISDAGATLSRDTVHQSSNSGAKVSLPGGGTYDVLIAVGIEDLLVAANDLSDVADADTAADNLGAARLNAITNVFSGVLESNRGGSQGVVSSRSTQSAANAIVGIYRFRGNDDGGASTDYADIAGRIVTNTDGSEAGKIQFRTMNGGTLATRAEILADGTLQDGSGNAYDAFPAGTRMLFGGTIPTGWTRDNASQSRVIRLAKSGDTIGATGGVEDLFDGAWVTLGHTLTESEIPSHTHTPLTNERFATIDTGDPGTVDDSGGGQRSHDLEATTGATGGGGAHSHSMSTPYYEIAAWATKD